MLLFNAIGSQTQISLTHWMISHHRLSTPVETKLSLPEILTNVPVRTDIARVFGKAYILYLEGLSRGELDRFDELPVSALVNIFSRIGVKQVSRIACVSKAFKKVHSRDKTVPQPATNHFELITINYSNPIWPNTDLLQR